MLDSCTNSNVLTRMTCRRLLDVEIALSAGGWGDPVGRHCEQRIQAYIHELHLPESKLRTGSSSIICDTGGTKSVLASYMPNTTACVFAACNFCYERDTRSCRTYHMASVTLSAAPIRRCQSLEPV